MVLICAEGQVVVLLSLSLLIMIAAVAVGPQTVRQAPGGGNIPRGLRSPPRRSIEAAQS